MNHVKLPIVLAFAGACCFGQAQAHELTYNQVTAAYVQLNDRDSDFDPNGFLVDGSFLVTENLYIRGNLISVSDSNSFLGQGIKIEVSSAAAGLGYRMPVSGQTDAIAEIGVGRSQTKASTGGMSAAENFTGFTVGLGMKHAFNSNFEASVLAGYERANKDAGSGVGVDFDGRYKLNDQFHLVAGYSWTDDKVDIFRVGVSYAF